jgi:catechol 2,3-dioxygenase-like lactoylglutathione lyase family enzyme
MMARLHHSAIVAHDLDSSLRFYRDGIGLEVLMDHVFEGDWPALFDGPSTRLRSVFLGDHRRPDAGVVELVVFDGDGPSGAPVPGASPTGAGFFLLSFYVDVDAVLLRLDALGFGPARRIEQPAPTGSVTMASLSDPDGVRIELVDVGAVAGAGSG